jgi:hypothetical protein
MRCLYCRKASREEMKTFSDWAKHYKVDKSNAAKRGKKNGMPGVKIGPCWILTPDEAEHFFKERK